MAPDPSKKYPYGWQNIKEWAGLKKRTARDGMGPVLCRTILEMPAPPPPGGWQPGEGPEGSAAQVTCPTVAGLGNVCRMHDHAQATSPGLAALSGLDATTFQDQLSVSLYPIPDPLDVWLRYGWNRPKAGDLLQVSAMCTVSLASPGDVAELRLAVVENVGPDAVTSYPITVQITGTARRPVTLDAQHLVTTTAHPVIMPKPPLADNVLGSTAVFLQARITTAAATLTFHLGARLDVEHVRTAPGY